MVANAWPHSMVARLDTVTAGTIIGPAWTKTPLGASSQSTRALSSRTQWPASAGLRVRLKADTADKRKTLYWR
jgi:hypothetical protein